MSAGPGHSVVFIHGAILSDGFVPVIEQTGIAENFQIVHYRRRGCAPSSRAVAGMTMQGWAGDCIALLNHLGIASAHCPRCGAATEPVEKFCGACGAALGAPPTVPPRKPEEPQIRMVDTPASEDLDGERKTVTALFADIKGSTELQQELDPEQARAIIDPALKMMIDAALGSVATCKILATEFSRSSVLP